MAAWNDVVEKKDPTLIIKFLESKRYLSNRLLSRADKIIPLEALSDSAIKQMISAHIDDVLTRVGDDGHPVDFDPAERKRMVEILFSKNFDRTIVKNPKARTGDGVIAAMLSDFSAPLGGIILKRGAEGRCSISLVDFPSLVPVNQAE